ncbi:MAG: hypothetical protein OXI92_11440 [Acidobacteriota bacterium]|nr:hypothetical protein [Acidobacteriota bacterium]
MMVVQEKRVFEIMGGKTRDPEHVARTINRAFSKIRGGAGHLAGKPEVLPFSISGGTW